MFQYEKKLQYPVRIKNPNPKLAAWVISQYGGPDGELGASLRYLSQRYAMPYPELKGLLTDIGTEELGHLEMIGAIVHQLTRGLTQEQLKEGGFAPYFVDHTTGVYPTAASGTPWNAAGIGVKGDVICDLTEDMAAEQKARVTYDNILRLSDDPDVSDVIRFLREREIVRLQRALSVFVHFSGTDSALSIAFQNILPGLVVEVAVVVGDHAVDPGGIDIHQIFQDLLFPAAREILD